MLGLPCVQEIIKWAVSIFLKRFVPKQILWFVLPDFTIEGQGSKVCRCSVAGSDQRRIVCNPVPSTSPDGKLDNCVASGCSLSGVRLLFASQNPLGMTMLGHGWNKCS